MIEDFIILEKCDFLNVNFDLKNNLVYLVCKIIAGMYIIYIIIMPNKLVPPH